jgi:hypothetical protein
VRVNAIINPVTVDSALTHPRNRWWRALSMVTGLALATGAAWLLPSGVAVAVAGVACLIALSVLVLNRAWIYSEFGYKSLLFAAVMLAILPISMSFAAARDLAMARSGSKHTVTVTAEREVDPPLTRGEDWHYRLIEGTQQLPGELVLSRDGLNPGDLVVVYSAGEWHELASDVEPADFWVIPAGVSFLVCLPFWLATGYFAPMLARREPAPPHRLLKAPRRRRR